MTVQWPWASGKTNPAPTKPKPKRRRRRKMSPAAKAMTTTWACTGLTMLIAAQMMEMTLLAVSGVLSVGIAGLTAWQAKRQTQPVPGPAIARPKPAKPGKTGRSGAGRGKPGTASVKCTRTGQPIDQCGCAKRHVATGDGARRYRRQVGDPIGGGKVSTVKQQPSARVPSTNNAKPQRQPVGEVMRRVY